MTTPAEPAVRRGIVPYTFRKLVYHLVDQYPFVKGGDKGERESGWYNDPWLWSNMRENTEHLVVFASDDDPFIPIDVQRRVGKLLADVSSPKTIGTFEYIELHKRSHFFGQKQQEILDVVVRLSNLQI